MIEENDATKRPVEGAPDYREMADRLHALAMEMLAEGTATGAQDLIETANRILDIAAGIRPQPKR